MLSKTLAIIATASLLLDVSAQEAKTSDVKAIATRVDARYNKMRTLSADFIERYAGAGVAREESGTLTLKRTGKMRWEFVQPKTKLFVSDGKTAYFYVPAEKQVRKAAVKKLDDLHSPIRYLLGKSKLNSEFENLRIAVEEKPVRDGNVVLTGIPKHLSDRVERVLLEISASSMIERIMIFEVDGSSTEFRFSRFVEDAPVPDERFRFRAPPGVETLQSDELMGD